MNSSVSEISINGRHQARVAVSRSISAEEMEQQAKTFATADKPHWLVKFFDDRNCLGEFDGSGALSEHDQKHHLAMVRVDGEETLFVRYLGPDHGYQA